MRRSLSARSLLLLLALSASACASSGPVSTGGTGSPSEPGASGPSAGQPPASASRSAPGAVPETLDFEAPLVGGGTFSGAQLAGTPVAIWFWAPW